MTTHKETNMRTMGWMGAVAAALVAAGCSSEHVTARAAPGDEGAATAGPGGAASGGGDTARPDILADRVLPQAGPRGAAVLRPAAINHARVELHLTSTRPAGYFSMLAPVHAVEVTTDDGRVLDVQLQRELFDLAHPEWGSLMGFVDVPDDAQSLAVVLRFDDFGSFIAEDGSGELDLRGEPVRYVVDRAQFVARGKAVVGVDTGRSVQPANHGARMLVPHVEIHF